MVRASFALFAGLDLAKATVIVTVRVTVRRTGCAESVARITTGKEPVTVAVPLMPPVVPFSESPVGSEPEAIAQVTGVVPPVATSVPLKALPAAGANELLEIASGAAIRIEPFAVALPPSTPATLTVKVARPAVVGTPEIVPVEGSIERPAGSAPAEREASALCSSRHRLESASMICSGWDPYKGYQIYSVNQTGYFHGLFGTNASQPVANDNNGTLELVVFDSYAQYSRFSGFLFGNDTNNPLDTGFGYSNAALGVFEFLSGYRFTTYTAGEFIITQDWRSTALLGHPLANALTTGGYIIALALGGGR